MKRKKCFRSILRYRNPTIHAVPSIDEDTESEDDTAVETLGYGELELFPEHYIHVDRPTVQLFTPDDTRCDTIHSELAISQMLVTLESRLGHEEVVGEEWEAMFHADWLSGLRDGAVVAAMPQSLLEFKAKAAASGLPEFLLVLHCFHTKVASVASISSDVRDFSQC